MCTTLLLLPLTLYFAGWVTPEQVRLALAQVNTPAREMLTVAPDQVPGFRTMDPRSRFCSHVSTSGFSTLALTVATPPDAAWTGSRLASEPSNPVMIFSLCGRTDIPSSPRRSCSNSWRYDRNG